VANSEWGRGGRRNGGFPIRYSPLPVRPRSGDHAHDVGFLHDQEFLAVDLDFGAAPLAEQDLVALLDVERDQLAGFVAAAGADGDDFAFLRLLLGGVRDDDAALSLFLALQATDDDAVMQWTEFHESQLPVSSASPRPGTPVG
jgi:hypothetical protein